MAINILGSRTNLPERKKDFHQTPTMETWQGNRKRPLDNNVRLEDSPYYKMRAIVRDLRPTVIEVLKTPEFQKCKAAEEICESKLYEMKIVMDLYKKMIAEPPQDGNKRQAYGNPPTDWASARHAETKPFISGSRQPELCITGGSAFGWNFITFPNSKTTYYGRTKASFRADNLKKRE